MKRIDKLAEDYLSEGCLIPNTCCIDAYVAGYKQAVTDAAEIIVRLENQQPEHASYLLKLAWDRIKALGEE